LKYYKLINRCLFPHFKWMNFEEAPSDILFFTKKINMSIYNLLGQLITNYEQVNKIDVSSFPIGMYILKSDKGDVIKFIKR
jgi:hypothetical protein